MAFYSILSGAEILRILFLPVIQNLMFLFNEYT
jgi:hypothetical protein